ncbi:MAG TPA: DMT family transporter [Chloroflexota bacterium]
MLLPLLLGLGSGLCWGVADFFGGLQSRRRPSLAVALWSQVGGGLALGLVLGLVVGPPLEAEGIAWGALAGVFGGSALMLFYRGLAVGMMSIVAPLSACGAAVPVAISFLLGRAPSPTALAGMAAAMLAVVLVSLPSEPGRHPAGRPGLALLLALGAATGFGLFFVFLDRGSAAGTQPLWVVGGARAGSMATLGLIALVGRRSAPWPGTAFGPIALIGITDTTANVLFTYATVGGNLGVVAVLGSLYPLATVALAGVVLGERLARRQALGVAAALGGVALIALG